MSIKKEIIIKDSCVLFDLVELNLLEKFFQLKLTVFTTPQVIAEVTDEKQCREIAVFIGDKSMEIDGKGLIEAIMEISNDCAGLTFTDCSVIELAIRKKATILSSDGSLRKVSTNKGLDVHGMLWIIEQLFEREILSAEEATLKLNEYSILNPWGAPKKQLELVIDKLKSVL